MARLVLFTQIGPKELKIGDKTIKICRCGLTKNPDGICDETHRTALLDNEDPMATYFYDADLKPEMVDMIPDEEDDLDSGCCGGHGHSHDGCACGNNSCGCGHKHE